MFTQRTDTTESKDIFLLNDSDEENEISKNTTARTDQLEDSESKKGDSDETDDSMAEASDLTITTRTPRRKRFVPNYNIEGVSKIIISEETQIAIELCVGPDVTGENPWKFVQKSLIQDHIDSIVEESEFYPLKEQISAYEENMIFMGYIADESKDIDQFYICLTKDSAEQCEQQSNKFKRRQEKKLQKILIKYPRSWKSLGSEIEIDELKPIKTRPLIEVEITTRYPKANQPDKFTNRNSNDVRDGLVELTPYRVKYNNILKRRVDAIVQAGSQTVSNEAQTVLRYPQNKWTQSITQTLDGAGENVDDVCNDIKKEKICESESEESEHENVKEDLGAETFQQSIKRMRRPSYIKKINSFVITQAPKVEAVVQLNSALDIYSDDYPKLMTKEAPVFYTSMTLEEYVCFTDVRAKNKFVCSAAFHPMWSGIVAIAYADVSPCVFKSVGRQEDVVQRAVYGYNPILIWSHIDSLKPKLYLETEREMKILSFCPFNENILIGGTINGQVILYDLTNKLERVEVLEVLSETRQKYRIAMNSKMGWMKNIHDKSIVHPTAVSTLQFSHFDQITSINWLSANYTVTNTGRNLRLNDDEPKSQIFLTGSMDGTILFWSLATDNIKLLEVKKSKKSKRIAKRPSGLTVDISPFKVLDRVLQPLYKIVLGYAGIPEYLPIQKLEFDVPGVNYIPAPNRPGTGRKYFKYEIISETEERRPERVYVGSVYGELAKFSWDGHDFNTGEIINSEFCSFVYATKIHDGPIVNITQNRFISSLFLSVGGHIFCIWCDDLQGKPVIWKKRKHRLTDASWSDYKPSILFISTGEGTLEIWDFLVRSDQPISVQTLSGSMITGIYFHRLKITKNIIGVGDMNGSFRLFLKPSIFMLENKIYTTRMLNAIKRDVFAKKTFLEWQAKWAKDNFSLLEERKSKEKALQIEKEEQKRKEIEELAKLREAEEDEKMKEKMRVIGPEERWQRLIGKLIEHTIAIKKRVNKAELIMQEQPLRELEAQRLEKEKKMVEIMKNQETIFKETVAILFPEAIPKKPKEYSKTLLEPFINQKKEQLIEYDKQCELARTIINKNPYYYNFEWRNTLQEGKERRRALDSYAPLIIQHKVRLDIEADTLVPNRVSKIYENTNYGEEITVESSQVEITAE